MNEIQSGEAPFSTQEALLALCLSLAGQEPFDAQQPCFNLYDTEILGRLGYRGKPLWEAANEAWADKKKGHVEYTFTLTARCSELIKAYREQCSDVEKLDGKAGELIAGIVLNGGAFLEDEMILRIACVILKTRGEYVNMWKQMIPLLRIPNEGKAKHFDTSIVSKGKIVEAKGVQRPGFKVVSLNASDKTKKAMGL